MGACLCGPPDRGIDSRYILQRKVGTGATADVWLGIERHTGIQCALKFQLAGSAFHTLGFSVRHSVLRLRMHFLAHLLNHPRSACWPGRICNQRLR